MFALEKGRKKKNRPSPYISNNLLQLLLLWLRNLSCQELAAWFWYVTSLEDLVIKQMCRTVMFMSSVLHCNWIISKAHVQVKEGFSDVVWLSWDLKGIGLGKVSREAVLDQALQVLSVALGQSWRLEAAVMRSYEHLEAWDQGGRAGSWRAFVGQD